MVTPTTGLPTPRLRVLDAIDAAIEAATTPSAGWRAHLGASVIGGCCDRQNWYRFRWALAIQHPARLLRLFDRGQREEERITGWLRAAGVTVYDTDPNTGEQFRFALPRFGGHVGGSTDGWCQGVPDAPAAEHILEYKTAGAKPFTTLIKKGVQEAKPEHYVQMQLYMLWSGKRRALYITVCKDNDAIHAERIRYDSVAAGMAEAHADAVLDANSPDECTRVSSRPDWYQCKWCDYHGVCYSGEPMARNCRTCRHSQPVIDEARTDAPWICEHYDNKEIPVAFQRIGCENWSAIK